MSNFIGASGSISSISVIDTNPASPTYNSTLSTPGLTPPPPTTRFLGLGATPNAQYVYALDGFNGTVDVICTGIIGAPANFTGCMTFNQFLFQIDFINHLAWSASTIGFPPVSYNIYRDAALQSLVATVPATGPLVYDDHNRSPNAQDTYYIIAVGSDGTVSSAVSVTPSSPC